jgi:hypothetical protein
MNFFIRIKKINVLQIIAIALLTWFIWTGYFKKYNTYINIADYYESKTGYDVEVIIDNESLINDTIDTKEYSAFGKIHPVRINYGRHKMIVKSDSLNLKDSITFYTYSNSVIYIEIHNNLNDFLYDKPESIHITKFVGSTVVYE